MVSLNSLLPISILVVGGSAAANVVELVHVVKEVDVGKVVDVVQLPKGTGLLKGVNEGSP